ncbi:MAG TPA: hypothetical protein VFY73_09710 [Ideonella sp.]|jgi:hypothetical protein|uniref:hypothetical protein n=1 Tax=Ideonella sp. TaxID=1929293 RepID=UPI002E2EDC22|nr:hypothetical protein [Ideonella sp.]HEX5684300.1 hypothetical protein [Ideonella sp.]
MKVLRKKRRAARDGLPPSEGTPGNDKGEPEFAFVVIGLRTPRGILINARWTAADAFGGGC